MSRGVRALFWILVVFSVIGVVAANATLHQGVSWVTGGVGVAAFIALFADATVSLRTERYALWNREQTPRENTVGYIALLSGAATVAIIATVLGGVAVAGMNNGYTHTVTAPVGLAESVNPKLNVARGGGRICGDDESYERCLSMHEAMYNTVCANEEGPWTLLNDPPTLTGYAEETCLELRDWILGGRDELDGCSYNCRTIAESDGRWGWSYLKPLPYEVTVRTPGTVEQRCYFLLGELSIGECSG